MHVSSKQNEALLPQIRQVLAAHHSGLTWTGMRPCVRANAAHWTRILLGAALDKVGQFKASVRAKVEYIFWVIKWQLDLTRARYKGLAKNTAQLTPLWELCRPSLDVFN
jgi:IS5 family transposase